MLERAFGVAGLSPDVFWRMTWNDYDTALYHADLQRQQALEGHRLVACTLWNAHFTNSNPKLGPVVKQKSPQEFLKLDLLDALPAAEPKETNAETWARLQAQGLM